MTDAPLTGEQALDAELSLPQYAGMTDQEAADAIMEKTVSIRRPVPGQEIWKVLATRGRWSELRRIANNYESPDPPYKQAITLVDMVQANFPVDLDEPSLAQNAPVLIQHSLLDANDVAAIDALADATELWVNVMKIGEVGIGAVINSRRRLAGV
jgi:hypothetical protein